MIRPTSDNADKVYKALAAFGAALAQFDVSSEDLAAYDGVLQMGVPPYQIDLPTRIPGFSFDEVNESNDQFELDE